MKPKQASEMASELLSEIQRLLEKATKFGPGFEGNVMSTIRLSAEEDIDIFLRGVRKGSYDERVSLTDTATYPSGNIPTEKWISIFPKSSDGRDYGLELLALPPAPASDMRRDQLTDWKGGKISLPTEIFFKVMEEFREAVGKGLEDKIIVYPNMEIIYRRLSRHMDETSPTTETSATE